MRPTMSLALSTLPTLITLALAATTTVGTLFLMLSKLCSRLPVIKKSMRPAGSSGRLLTCGPPGWIVTSRPNFL